MHKYVVVKHSPLADGCEVFGPYTAMTKEAALRDARIAAEELIRLLCAESAANCGIFGHIAANDLQPFYDGDQIIYMTENDADPAVIVTLLRGKSIT